MASPQSDEERIVISHDAGEGTLQATHKQLLATRTSLTNYMIGNVASNNPAPSNPEPSGLAPPNPAPSNPVSSNPVLSNPVQYNPVSSNPAPANRGELTPYDTFGHLLEGLSCKCSSFNVTSNND